MDRISEQGVNYVCNSWRENFSAYDNAKKSISDLLHKKDFSEDERKVFLKFMDFGFLAGLGHAEASIREHNLHYAKRPYKQFKTKLETGKWQYELDEIARKEWEARQQNSTDTKTH